jgi:type I restriction-modification system DNA methylase subunit
MSTKEEAFKKIQDLVTRFEEQFESYKQSDYNETLTRRDFIDPFFKALGWDVDNSDGYAEAYREVIHEDRIKIGNASKAPDYSFRLNGGKKLFFVEAKKPSVSIKDDISVSYQIRRYGWNAKLAISVITDFEEFAVYDCTKKPNPTDKTGIARIKYINFKDYIKEFDYLWNIFSKEQVLKGSFDRYVKSDTVKKGTSTVDREFLASLDSWRTYLATSISLKNKQLDEEEINYAVQLIIDRLIFLRIAEDRRVEQYGQMKFAVNQKGDAYQNLFFIFKKADEKYNSGLFDFKKDIISESLHIDNKVIKTIVNEMYYPSPYEFSQIPVEILGSAYEQFLGKVIRITPSHHAKIEEKPEVRKAGGVYYTPQYIVDYIVKNTVGKLIEGKTPKQISEIKICDPACGSGSFLIGAYQYLLDFHKNFYTDNGTRVGKKDSPVTPQGNLTAAEKKRILLNNIYGVDIDVNAVEVTKLSLLIKCMEGETATTIEQQQKLWHERILPTLDNNIKCGNSLVDIDFYDSFIDFGDQKKIKPFNWIKAFPEVFKKPHVKKEKENLKELADKTKFHASKALEYANMLDAQINHIAEPDSKYSEITGFDVVIGNPPWVDIKGHPTELIKYYFDKFRTTENRINLYSIFLEQGLRILSKDGILGFIIPNSILYQSSYQKLRNLVLNNYSISKIVRLPDNTFQNIKAETIILSISKSEEKTECILYNRNDIISDISYLNWKERKLLNSKDWLKNEFSVFDIFSNNDENQLLKKIERNKPELVSLCDFTLGLTPYDKYKGHTQKQIKDRVFHSTIQKDISFKPLLEGADVKRYSVIWGQKEYISYGNWLGAPREPRFFKSPRILIRQIVSGNPLRIYAGYVDSEFYNTQSVFNLISKDENKLNTFYLLALLNSNLINFYHNHKYLDLSKNLFQKILIQNCKKFPIKTIDSENIQEVQKQSEIIKLVGQLVQLIAEKTTAKLQSKIELIESKIDYCEEKINQLVYQLYELTEEEISIIEKQ